MSKILYVKKSEMLLFDSRSIIHSYKNNTHDHKKNLKTFQNFTA